MRFIYLGHTCTANIIKDYSYGDYRLEVESLHAEPIEKGIYPVNFAIEQATEEITNLTMNDKNLDETNGLSVANAVDSAIRQLITNGTFEKAGI